MVRRGTTLGHSAPRGAREINRSLGKIQPRFSSGVTAGAEWGPCPALSAPAAVCRPFSRVKKRVGSAEHACVQNLRNEVESTGQWSEYAINALHPGMPPKRLEQGFSASNHLGRSLPGRLSKSGIQDSLRPRGQCCSGTLFRLGLEQVCTGLCCFKHGLWQTSKPGAPDAERRFRQTAGEAVQEGDLRAAI